MQFLSMEREFRPNSLLPGPHLSADSLLITVYFFEMMRGGARAKGLGVTFPSVLEVLHYHRLHLYPPGHKHARTVFSFLFFSYIKDRKKKKPNLYSGSHFSFGKTNVPPPLQPQMSFFLCYKCRE